MAKKTKNSSEDNIIRFVKPGGLVHAPKPKEYISFAWAAFGFSIPGIAIGYLNGSFWKLIANFMLLVYFLAVVTVTIIVMALRRNLTLKRRYITETIICSNAFLQVLLSVTSMQTKWFGVNVRLLLIYLPAAMSMLLWWRMIRKSLKEKQEDLHPKKLRIKIVTGVTIAFAIIYVGYTLINTSNIGQDAVVLLAIVGFLFLSTVLAAGLMTTILQLYYCIQCEKE